MRQTGLDGMPYEPNPRPGPGVVDARVRARAHSLALHPAQRLELVVEGTAQAPPPAAVGAVDQADVVHQDVAGAHGIPSQIVPGTCL